MSNEITIAPKMPSVPKLTDRAPDYDQLSHSSFVSVVMPSFNQRHFIGEAIESVLGQSHAHLELIVADGGSSDGTIDLLQHYASIDVRLRWTSRSDDGPADAVNRALNEARGTLIGWLNSDDLFTQGALERSVRAFESNHLLIMHYGAGLHIDEAGDPICLYPTLPPSVGIDAFKDGCFICQPTVVFKKVMFKLLGPLDHSLKTAFDYDYWLRAFQSFPDRIGFATDLQALSRLHEGTITSAERERVAIEGAHLVKKYLHRSALHWFYSYVDEAMGFCSNTDEKSECIKHLHQTLSKMQNDLSAQDVSLGRIVLENLGKTDGN